MNDEAIVALYWARDELAITETASKYGTYLLRIAQRLVREKADSEECVNDTYLGAWNAIPPQRPSVLQTFLGKLTRRIAIDCFRKQTAQKRGGWSLPLSLSELGACVPSRLSTEDEAELHRLTDVVNHFVGTLPLDKRRAFLLRYWYAYPVQEIAALFGWSESKTSNLLRRVRHALREQLEQEGFFYD